MVWLIAPVVGFTRKYVKNNIGYSIKANNAKSIEDLGIKYHSLNDSIVDHVKQIRGDGLI